MTAWWGRAPRFSREWKLSQKQKVIENQNIASFQSFYSNVLNGKSEKLGL